MSDVKAASAFVLIVAAMVLVTVVGNMNCTRNELRHLASDTFGYERDVTLLDANGGVIRKWEKITSKVEDKGGTCYFIDANDKAVTISGTFVIEER